MAQREDEEQQGLTPSGRELTPWEQDMLAEFKITRQLLMEMRKQQGTDKEEIVSKIEDIDKSLEDIRSEHAKTKDQHQQQLDELRNTIIDMRRQQQMQQYQPYPQQEPKKDKPWWQKSVRDW